MKEKKSWGTPSQIRCYFQWLGFFHAGHRYASQQQMLWECPFAFLSLPLFLSASFSPPAHCGCLCSICGSEAVQVWVERSSEPCTACGAFLEASYDCWSFNPTSLLAQIISNEKCHFNDTRKLWTIVLPRRRSLHYHEPKCVYVWVCRSPIFRNWYYLIVNLKFPCPLDPFSQNP